MPSRADRFRDIAQGAREKTNDALSEEMAALTPLTQDEIARMLPTKADKEAMARLMAIVASGTADQEKLVTIRDNIEDLGGVLVKVLRAVLLR